MPDFQLLYDPSLPICQRRDDIRSAIANNQVVILCGETGSGKSTQIPKILLEMGLAQRGCEAARAEGQGYASEKADIGATYVQSGTDLVGADWERRLAADGKPSHSIRALNSLFYHF